MVLQGNEREKRERFPSQLLYGDICLICHESAFCIHHNRMLRHRSVSLDLMKDYEEGFLMQGMQVFNYQDMEVRTLLKDGEPWWVASDVCKVLAIVNNRDAMSRLDDDEKGVGIADTPGGKQTLHIVNESGLYHLIFQSRKEQARQFRKWVTGEVLPSLRKTGSYSLQPIQPQEPVYTLGDALRQRALSNEDAVPNDLFATQIEFGKELYYWEKMVNAYLDNKSQIEISIGKCWPSYAKKFLNWTSHERRRYRHRLPNGRIIEAWGYPMKYLPAFRRWLRDVYFVEKFPAYQQHRARRIGVEPKRIGTKPMHAQLPKADSGTEQLLLFA